MTLKELRLERMMSQETLAFEAGMSPTTVWQAERGKRMSFGTVRRLAKALGLDPSDLAFLREERHETPPA
jgi:transcriptional regulator with XRE-family HTH domain